MVVAAAVCMLAVGVATAAEPCYSPLPDLAKYNKLIPDLSVVPLPMVVSLQPIMITDISPRCVRFWILFGVCVCMCVRVGVRASNRCAAAVWLAAWCPIPHLFLVLLREWAGSKRSS